MIIKRCCRSILFFIALSAALLLTDVVGLSYVGFKVSPTSVVIYYDNSENVLPFLAGLKLGFLESGNGWINLNLYNLPNQTLPKALQHNYLGYVLGISDLFLKAKAQKFISYVIEKNGLKGDLPIRVELLPLRVRLYRVRDGLMYLGADVDFDVNVEILGQDIGADLRDAIQQAKQELTLWANRTRLFDELRAVIWGVAVARLLKKDKVECDFLMSWASSFALPGFEINLERIFMSVYSQMYFVSKYKAISGGIPGLTAPIDVIPVDKIIENWHNKLPLTPLTIPLVEKNGKDNSIYLPAEYICPVCGRRESIELFDYHPVVRDMEKKGYPENYPDGVGVFPGNGYKSAVVYTLCQCKKCGHLYVAQRPPEEWDTTMPENFLRLQEKGANLAERVKKELVKAEEDLKPIWERVPQGSVVLDIGAGLGQHVLVLRKKGYRAFGVELSSLLAKFCLEVMGVPVMATRFESLNLPPNSVDAVTMFTVLEHVNDPEKLVREVFRILKPGGVLLIAELPSLVGYVARAQGPYYHELKIGHIHFFTERSIKKLLENAGFYVDETFYMVDMEYRAKEVKRGILPSEDYEFLKEILDRIKEEIGDQMTVVAIKKMGKENVVPKGYAHEEQLPIESLEMDLDSLAVDIFSAMPDEIRGFISEADFVSIVKDALMFAETPQEREVVLMSFLYSLNLSGIELYRSVVDSVAEYGYNAIKTHLISAGEKAAQKILDFLQSHNDINNKGGIVIR